MTLIDGFIFAGIVLLGVPVAILIGMFLAWITKLEFFRWAVPLALVLTIFVGIPLYLDSAGIPTTGTVELKNERISTFRDGDWVRRLNMNVVYRPPGSREPLKASVGVDREQYDRLAVGSPVSLVYLPQRPGIVKVVGRKPFAWVTEGIPQSTSFRAGILFVMLIGIAVALWGGSNTGHVPLVRRPILSLVICLWVAGFAVTIAQYVAPPRDPPATMAARGRVRTTRRITETWLQPHDYVLQAPRPFDLVEIEFVAPSVGGKVIGVDAVDTGSVPGLRPDTTLPIHYAASDPRVVRLDGGTRDFRGPNNRAAWMDIGTSLGFAGLVLGGIYLIGRRRRRKRANEAIVRP